MKKYFWDKYNAIILILNRGKRSERKMKSSLWIDVNSKKSSVEK